MIRILLFLIYTTLCTFASTVSLQVLGSGGPESGDKRASSAYLIWIDGKSRILIDFGGGASLRFEEAGAQIKDLNVILLTHLHADHTADLPTLLKSSFFTKASGKLYLFGPHGNHLMPDTGTFIKRLFKDNQGAWQYLGDHLDGSARLQLKTKTIHKTLKPKTIYKQGDIHISTISVHHGPIPALAYRVDIGKKSITFSGDMNGEYQTLEKLALGTNILVLHNAIPKHTKGVATHLHMTPLTIGKIAKEANARSIVISHRMLRTLGKEKQTQSEIRKHYKGKVNYANDKDIYKLR